MRTPYEGEAVTENAGIFLHMDRDPTPEELRGMDEAMRAYSASLDTEAHVNTIQETMTNVILQQKDKSYMQSFGNTRPHPDSMDFSKAPIIARQELLRLYPKDTVVLHGLLDECLHELQLLYPSLQITILYSYLMIQATEQQDELHDDDDGQLPLLLATFDDSECAMRLLPEDEWFPGTRQIRGTTIQGQDG